MSGTDTVLFCIMPFVDRWDLTEKAAGDVVDQHGVRTRLLLIDNGGSRETRASAEEWAEANGLDRVMLWSHNPPLPSLAATWNRALDFVWEAGGEKAWVCNNDVRLHPKTAYRLLEVVNEWAPAMLHVGAPPPFFVTAVGVEAAQFNACDLDSRDFAFSNVTSWPPGGPDFSCYIITKECHQKYRFDENFIPAYGEDCDYHRRLMLDGHGRRIFSVNVPFLHIDRGSGTLKGMSPERRRRTEEQINNVSRAHYARKWGGAVNAEKYRIPFDTASEEDHYTNPELQARVWEEKADR